MERDDIGGDDIIRSTVSPHGHPASSERIFFRPKERNPSYPQQVSFTETRQWHRDDVDTELGGEEIYARASLFNWTLNHHAADANSNRLNVSP
jgi:hypothetical protein